MMLNVEAKRAASVLKDYQMWAIKANHESIVDRDGSF